MDDRVWTEQVEAALESGDRSFLHALASLAPNTARPEVALTRCRLQVALGDAAAAGAAFPPLHDVEETPALHRAWADTSHRMQALRDDLEHIFTDKNDSDAARADVFLGSVVDHCESIEIYRFRHDI